MLTALSRGAGGGAGAVLLPAMLGRLAGGAGGAGLALAAAAVAAPLVAGTGLARGAAGGGGGGVGLGAGAGAACSSRYASGVQPCTDVAVFIHNHQPFPSLETICTISPARIESSFDWALLKSYKTLAVGFLCAGGLEGGGGGGPLIDPDDAVRV